MNTLTHSVTFQPTDYCTGNTRRYWPLLAGITFAQRTNYGVGDEYMLLNEKPLARLQVHKYQNRYARSACPRGGS